MEVVAVEVCVREMLDSVYVPKPCLSYLVAPEADICIVCICACVCGIDRLFFLKSLGRGRYGAFGEHVAW